jgi:hypothetical protein
MTPDEIAKLIPPEVVKAAAIELCRKSYEHVPKYDWRADFSTDCDYWLSLARAAIAAGLAKWPGMAIRVMPYEALILPLPAKEAGE